MKTLTTIKLVLLTILILSSCSQRARCKRIIKKAEKNNCISYKQDTFILKDTINGWQFDTSFISINNIDTFIVEKNNVKTKTIVDWQQKKINQKILVDTIFIEKIILREYPVIKKFPFWKRNIIIWIFLALFLIYMLFKK